MSKFTLAYHIIGFPLLGLLFIFCLDLFRLEFGAENNAVVC